MEKKITSKSERETEEEGRKWGRMEDENNIKTVICDRGREKPDGNVVMEED